MAIGEILPFPDTLLMALTRDMINLELGDFIRGHYRAVLAQGNYTRIKQAWDSYIAQPNEQDLAVLKQFNIPPEKQQAFILELEQRYGSQFTDDPRFVRQVTQVLTIQTDTEAHAINCAGLANLDQLFKNKPFEVRGSGHLFLGFFNCYARSNTQPLQKLTDVDEDVPGAYINSYR